MAKQKQKKTKTKTVEDRERREPANDVVQRRRAFIPRKKSGGLLQDHLYKKNHCELKLSRLKGGAQGNCEPDNRCNILYTR